MNTIKNTLVENLATQGQEKLSINGIKDKYIRENMKKLMENQIRQDVGSAVPAQGEAFGNLPFNPYGYPTLQKVLFG